MVFDGFDIIPGYSLQILFELVGCVLCDGSSVAIDEIAEPLGEGGILFWFCCFFEERF